jgi:hypothetical protein
MSEQDNGKESILQRPTTNNREDWRAYWKQQGSWRCDPEIDEERQKYLNERRKIKPDSEHDIYPFKDIKLTRADVEWLLVTHSSSRGPVDRSDKNQRKHKGLDLRQAILNGENLSYLQLFDCDFSQAQLQGASFVETWLPGANFSKAQLQSANLTMAILPKANLCGAKLQGANLYWVHFVYPVHREDRDRTGPQLTDVQWGDTNLAVADWTQFSILGDEAEAKKHKNDTMPYIYYERATRAYRQLSVALRNQGLNEDAARFAYRAQLMQRAVLKARFETGQYLFSLFLDLLSGYGYKPWRCFAAYLIVIAAFATAYFIIGHTVGPALSPLGSVVFSMTSFHGRGFFPGGIGLDDPLTVVAAFEAFVGLLIEVTFIATLTQRLFGK